MKRFLSLLLIIVLILLLPPSVHADAAVDINQTKLTLYVGHQYTLKVNGTSSYVRWTSDNKKAATVTSKGVVKGINSGTATITATVGLGSKGKKYTCKVVIKSRLSANKAVVSCLLDEYDEIIINFKKPIQNEYLYCSAETSSVSTEWVDDADKNILRILPKEIGKTTLTIGTMTGTNFFDEKVSSKEQLKIDVFVFRDREWISQADLNKFEISASYFNDFDTIVFSKLNDDYSSYTDVYTIENIEANLVKNKVYTDGNISYKYDGKNYFFMIKELQDLNILD